MFLIQPDRHFAEQLNEAAVVNLDSEFEKVLKGVADAARRATQCFGFCEVNPFHATSMEQTDVTFSPSTHPNQFTSEEAA